jgi:hypothetical protein
MSVVARIVAAEPVIHGVLKIRWDDDYEEIVDLRPMITRAQISVYLRKPESFAKLKIDENGRGIVWMNEKGEEIDLGAGSLRQLAVRQAELRRNAA